MTRYKDLDDYGSSGHHIKPQSRGGDRNNGNLIKLSVFFHSNWHNAFANLTAHEVIHVIKRIDFSKNGKPELVPIKYRPWCLPKNFLKYWQIIFDDLNQREAIEFIRVLFLRKNREVMKKFWKTSDIARLRSRIKRGKVPVRCFR